MRTLARSIDEFPPLEQACVLGQIKNFLVDTLCQGLFDGVNVNTETFSDLRSDSASNIGVRNVIDNTKKR